MTEPLGKDCNGKPIYVGSDCLIVFSRMGYVGWSCKALGAYGHKGCIMTDLSESPKYAIAPSFLMVIDPEPDTIEERKDVSEPVY